MAIAVFNYAQWSARYPEFNTVAAPTVTEYFNEAVYYLDNTDCSPVQDVNRRLVLLNMITAHIAALSMLDPTGQTLASPLVGRISNATEGSVSVATDVGTQSASAAFWMQTKYGFAYWQATASLRLGRYIPAPPRCLGLNPWRRW